MDRSRFFRDIRATAFQGNLTQGQVDGLNDILDAFELAYPKGDSRWLAYMLATVFHETDRSMLPIEEYGKGHGRPYGKPVPPYNQVYYGRGYVQLTWAENYKKMSEPAGVDLLANPDQALKPSVAFKVMAYGMEHGSFTGKKLSDYFNDRQTDFLNARRIINGLDCAAKIAMYAREFNQAIS